MENNQMVIETDLPVEDAGIAEIITGELINEEVTPESIDSLIVVEQLPIITEQLSRLSEVINERIQNALALPCTEKTRQEIKNIRAALRKEFDELDQRRRNIKISVMEPYNVFESAFKKCTNKYKEADEILKSGIDNVENGMKQQKRDELQVYFEELCVSLGIDFIAFEHWNPNVTLTVSLKNLKEQADQFLSQIADGLTAIAEMEHKDEIMAEYAVPSSAAFLNLSKSVATVGNRHRAIEEQKQSAEEKEKKKEALAEAVKKVDEAFSLGMFRI
jgi:predicted secreted protein